MIKKINKNLIRLEIGLPSQAFEWRNKYYKLDFFNQQNIITKKEHEQYLTSLVSDKSKCLCTIYHDKDPVGVGGLVNIDWINKNAEVSLYFDYDNINESEIYILYLTSLDNIFNIGFDTYNLQRLYGISIAGHKYERHYLNAGLKPEGVLVNRFLRKTKGFVNGRMLAIIKHEWEHIKDRYG